MSHYSSILMILAAIPLGLSISYLIIRKFSKSFEAYYVEGIRLKEQGQLDQALSNFKEVIREISAKNFLTPSTYLSMAEIYFKKKQFDEAARYIDLAIKNYKKYNYPSSFEQQAEKLKARYKEQQTREAVYA